MIFSRNATSFVRVISVVLASSAPLAFLMTTSVAQELPHVNPRPETLVEVEMNRVTSELPEFDVDAIAGQQCRCTDLVLIVDLTSSMGDALSNIKSQLSDTQGDDVLDCAQASAGTDLRVGLITFDGIDYDNWVTVVQPLTDNISAVRVAIGGLSMGYGGWGTQESSDEALKEMLRATAPGVPGSICSSYNTGEFNVPFRANCAKIAVLLTDSPPGGCDDPLYFKWPNEVAAHVIAVQAASAGIHIAALRVPLATSYAAVEQPTERVMRDYARTTSGEYMVVNQGQRTLNPLRDKDFHKELVVPAGGLALSLDAVG